MSCIYGCRDIKHRQYFQSLPGTGNNFNNQEAIVLYFPSLAFTLLLEPHLVGLESQ